MKQKNPPPCPAPKKGGRTFSTIILGLTGGIGIGKSTVSKMAVSIGIPVFNADHYIHRALNKNGVGVARVRAAFPNAYNRTGQKINRNVLGQIIFKDPSARHILEKILHPLVRTAETRFIERHQQRGTRLIILDIPLLFETGADRLCTAVMVVSAPVAVQRARVLSRPHMTLEKFSAIKRVQMGNAQRLARADYILDTGGAIDQTQRHLQQILKQIQKDHA